MFYFGIGNMCYCQQCFIFFKFNLYLSFFLSFFLCCNFFFFFLVSLFFMAVVRFTCSCADELQYVVLINMMSDLSDRHV